jgi:hypothetical protein
MASIAAPVNENCGNKKAPALAGALLLVTGRRRGAFDAATAISYPR